MISGMANAWSSNNQGNYWSDFKTRYPNATATNNVWDTAFYINENNIDHYSLVSPLANPTLSASYAGMISLASPTAPSTIPMPNLPQLSPTQTAISANKNITIIAIVAITLTVAIIVLTFSIRKNMSHCKEPA
jgi:nitrous oxidase accessory protein NosD